MSDVTGRRVLSRPGAVVKIGGPLLGFTVGSARHLRRNQRALQSLARVSTEPANIVKVIVGIHRREKIKGQKVQHLLLKKIYKFKI